ncbi:putative deoxyguanosinetriphosphate triphosphohydrolase [Pseudomonas matsuisoli]|uniref:Deoxyguanosinetriphosphate triphosphohydrolase n=2 Tax=Pseudomonas matsuisoli TaxID=1515666 RepID=A0A917UZC2_9PSED|nr:putative deoxyguanosinetriphosphate triphosphohydrolase [Pseudomonas matsuisoli]
MQAFESDRGRIVNSAAVRRLQQKTQVFPLERNAAVRSRLTHSLEVQQVGRFIVRTLFQKLGDQAPGYGLAGLERAVESLVEMACLMHDVGNPPFGHFGEFAISEWFERHLDEHFDTALADTDHDAALRHRMLADLKQFEGNAQTIRLVVSLLRLNLTYTQTACLLKYVRAAYRPRPAAGTAGAYLAKKPGFYLSEEPFVEALCLTQGMAPGSRHPLAYVMEAADDISYCLADIEDSVEKGILDIETLAELLVKTFALHRPDDPAVDDKGRRFGALIAYARERSQNESINKVSEFFIWLRVNMIHPLVEHAADQFIAHIDAIHAGTFDRALMEDDSPAHAVVQTFKDVARERVFCHREVETLHLQGYRILQGLLDFYAPLLRVDPATFDALTTGRYARNPHLQMLARRLPSQLVKAYHEAIKARDGLPDQALWEFYHRCRLLQDVISGMTDQHAQDEYRTLAAL